MKVMGYDAKILDCEDISSIKESLNNIFEIHSDLGLILNNYGKKYKVDISKDELFELFVSDFQPKLDYDYLYLFHMTRAFDTNSYIENGLLSRKLSDHLIWNNLFKLLGDRISLEKKIDIKKKYVDNVQRTYGNVEDDGPFGIMILQTIRRDSHILKCPELIDDYIKAIFKETGFDIKEEVELATKPIIIKFKIKLACNQIKYITEALFFLYYSLNSFDFSHLYDCSVNVLINHKVSVSPEDIIWIKELC